jgi:hypothetical protein
VAQEDILKREGVVSAAQVRAERKVGTESEFRDLKAAKPATKQISRDIRPNYSFQGSQMALCVRSLFNIWFHESPHTHTLIYDRCPS